MIFSAEMLEVEETSNQMKFLHGQEIGPHLAMCHELREYDEQNGMSGERQFQHVASLPEIVVMKLIMERPEVFRDGIEMSKWLRTEEARPFRVARDARPIKGDGLQLIIR
jgi:hypothetical protein